ncbi:hypothetical protein VC34_23770 [Pseudomonas fluorescens]|uniref:Uncharacterized protein n=1 Tax=Pseudomonas fluorescens TaxID=294 RepID=A0A0F4T2P1_PSEFL|nr:hypothetical protein VC34_23770 [Pseudomonas fluorescens]
MGVMKKLGSAHCERALWAGMPEVGAKAERCVEWAKAIASKLAPTGDLRRSQIQCGSGLAREEA